MVPESFDVVVVGNGVIGLSIALAVADEEPTASIAVVGRADHPFGATPASGAMLGCFGEVTATSVASDRGREKLGLSIAARALWPEWLDRLGPESGQILTARETVVLLNTVGSANLDSANFAAIRGALQDAGEPCEEVAVEDVEWIDPDPNARPLRALSIPGEGAVNSAALMQALATALAKAGATFIDDAVTGLWIHAGQAKGVRLADSVLAAGVVVVAAGVATGPLLQSMPELVHRIPLVIGGCGVSALVDTLDGTVPPYVLRTPNRSFACGLHVLPRSAGTVYIGATNEATFEPQPGPTISEVNFLTSCAVRQIRKDLDGSQLRKIQAGNRPMSIDGWPLIGPTSIDGLWIVTGTYRDGLHLSPLLAREIAKRLTSKDHLWDIEQFRPEREPVSGLTRTQVLEEAVCHTLASGFELPWHLEPDWPTAIIGKFARTAFETLLDELGGAYVPPPEVLSVLHKSSGSEMVAWLRAYYEDVYAAWH